MKETTHDQYYLRRLKRDYGENFLTCSGFIATSFSFILFIVTISVYMSFCLIEADIKHEMTAKLASQPEDDINSVDKNRKCNLLSKNKKDSSSTSSKDSKKLKAGTENKLNNPKTNGLHKKTINELNTKLKINNNPKINEVQKKPINELNTKFYINNNPKINESHKKTVEELNTKIEINKK
ncbi:HzNVorf94-like protein [Microplitis demolitor]|nr:HzNVorf94-like protein [Microplitis demolitor]